MANYAAYMRHQVTELLTDYGDIDIIWFDFSYPGEDGKGRDDWASEELLAVVRSLRPNILVNDRLDLPGSADLVTPEQVVPTEGLRDDDGNPVVWEGCQTFSGSWGYHRDEASWKSNAMLVQMLVEHVSKGGNLLLNVGPTGRGEFDARAVDRLQGMGAWMRRHDRAIYGCGAAPEDYPAGPDVRYTYNPEIRRLYAHLFTWPFKTIRLPRLGGKVAYAHLLHDAGEVPFRTDDDGALVLELPVVRPEVEVPVIELFLGEEN
jgi:alpha-L-fucosidase